MRITLAGCGALGSVFGAGLIESGAELQIYQRRGVTFDTLSRQGGIRLISAGESQPRLYPFSRISDRAGELEPADLILVLVKAYQTAELSSLTAGLLEDGAVLSLQNGLGNAELLADFFGEERVAAGVATYGAYTVEPGTVQAAGSGLVSLGPWKPKMSLEWVARALEAAGFTTEYSEDPRPFLWRKVAVNAMVNTVAALTRMRNGLLRKNDYALQLMRRLGLEAVEAASRAGVELDFERLWEFFMENLRKTSSNKPSMLQDVEAGRRSEIDGISGSILTYAEDEEEFPATRTVYELIKGIDESFL